MSAEVLRQAAALMRESVATVPPSPWGTVEGTMGKIGMVTVVYGAAPEESVTHPPVVYDVGMEMGPAASYVASWHPAVALAVADWLDEAADADERNHRELGFSPIDVNHPLAVAHAYLAEEA